MSAPIIARVEIPRAGVAESAPRPWLLCGLALVLAGLVTVASRALLGLIHLLTQLAFYGTWSTANISPAGHTRGAWVIVIPAIGGVIIGLMARFGARGVVGHGIPEVMQQVLSNRSRISPKVAVLKPISSAISIGSGGPFGAEGPVIATGSAVGSLLGQFLTTTSVERKTLLAAGAAAGMTAVFGTPVAATLLAVELLLFEFRARSVIPVALAAVGAEALRLVAGRPLAEFSLEAPIHVQPGALVVCVVIGVIAGVLAMGVTTLVHAIEAGFARSRLPWMVTPAVGGLVVGLIGWLDPRVLGAGYGSIDALLVGGLSAGALLVLFAGKLIAWTTALGSGTSGGTLAPMLVIGGSVGALVGHASEVLGGGWTLSPGLAALAGMAAFFAGGSRALFASILLGVEMTQQAGVLLPLLAAAGPAVLVSHRLARHSLMSAPVELKGVRVPADFSADAFSLVSVATAMDTVAPLVAGELTVGELADRIGAQDPAVTRHQAVLLTNVDGALCGLVTRRDVLAAVARGEAGRPVGELGSKTLVTVFPDETLDIALARMTEHDIGRLPVVERGDAQRVVGYLGRTAFLAARQMYWHDEHARERGWWAASIKNRAAKILS